MRVAVVTPSYQTPQAWLNQCLESVRDQNVPYRHFIVSDGDPGIDVSGFENVQVIYLPQPHGAGGNTPRAVGSVVAMAQGFDAIAYLDADNWYYPHHLESLIELHHQTRAAICTSRRTLHHLDGTLLIPCPEDDGIEHVDTSCFLFTRAAFGLIPLWGLMDVRHSVEGDRVVWANVKDWGITHADSGRYSVAYRTHYPTHYQALGLEPPPGATRSTTLSKVVSPGFPIWSPLFLRGHQEYPPACWPPASIAAAQIAALPLRPINIIFAPDWQLSDDLIYRDLRDALLALANHPDRDQMTLLIDTSQTYDADVELYLCDVAMNLLLQEEIEIQQTLKISLIEKMSKQGWELLRPQLHYKISPQSISQNYVSSAYIDSLPELVI